MTISAEVMRRLSPHWRQVAIELPIDRELLMKHLLGQRPGRTKRWMVQHARDLHRLGTRAVGLMAEVRRIEGEIAKVAA